MAEFCPECGAEYDGWCLRHDEPFCTFCDNGRCIACDIYPWTVDEEDADEREIWEGG